ncbi:hypothetical protein QFZ37_002796 [Chryseobacterium ginsenosidimutans]|nr:hypothetical protein [Chryseobacterium ginsenosidimutans]
MLGQSIYEGKSSDKRVKIDTHILLSVNIF